MNKVTLYISKYQLKQMLEDSTFTVDRIIFKQLSKQKEHLYISIKRSD